MLNLIAIASLVSEIWRAVIKTFKTKTDLLNFTLGENQNQQLTFGGTTLIDTAHKHLGITLQTIGDGKNTTDL